ncbi:MAG: prepilin-type N-terminal cleavage/methylation domain-containing protein [Elusimicrobia bacterium]|nr:prepilin-type N-terminal cleavage/methylation domain-containing protein [Elusimicrobiota bacterium]
MTKRQAGVTLTELMLGVAIMGIMVAGFASLLKYVIITTTKAQTTGEAQENTRQGLMRIEEALAHASQVTVTSSTFVEFVADLDQSPSYDPNGDLDGDGIPNYRDGDRDDDANQLVPAANQWRTGFNLKDDDEDSDGQTDVRQRLYLSNRAIYLDASLNGGAWGGSRLKTLMTNVSTFTLTYWGNKANTLGRNLDRGYDGLAGTADTGENDGVISSREMDMVAPPAGMGDRNGLLDTANERRYVTTIRVYLGADRNRDGTTDYAVETDVYPPLLPLKSR